MAVDNTEVVEFDINDKVEHPKWGLGVVMHRSGSGDKAKVMVQFYKEDKMKTLMVKFAKLKKVGTAAPPPKSYVKPIIEEEVEETHPENDSLPSVSHFETLKEEDDNAEGDEEEEE
ncbi:MAG: hypothetical protein ACE14V_13535 [bacterium]